MFSTPDFCVRAQGESDMSCHGTLLVGKEKGEKERKKNEGWVL